MAPLKNLNGPYDITFKNLKLYYLADGDADGNKNLNVNIGEIKLSWFRGATLNDGSSDSVVKSLSISIKNDFRGKYFGSVKGGGKK